MKILPKKIFKIPSKSRKGELHIVTKLFDRWYCDEECMGFSMRGKCSHVEEAKLRDKQK